MSGRTSSSPYLNFDVLLWTTPAQIPLFAPPVTSPQDTGRNKTVSENKFFHFFPMNRIMVACRIAGLQTTGITIIKISFEDGAVTKDYSRW